MKKDVTKYGKISFPYIVEPAWSKPLGIDGAFLSGVKDRGENNNYLSLSESAACLGEPTYNYSNINYEYCLHASRKEQRCISSFRESL